MKRTPPNAPGRGALLMGVALVSFLVIFSLSKGVSSTSSDDLVDLPGGTGGRPSAQSRSVGESAINKSFASKESARSENATSKSSAAKEKRKGSEPVDHVARFGTWSFDQQSSSTSLDAMSPTCQCDGKCYAQGAARAKELGSVEDWGPKALDDYIDQMAEVWERQGGITRDHHVSMVCCSYRTMTHRNPSGVWLHIANRTATALRIMVDGYRRQHRILQYIRKVVAQSPEPLKPMVLYISTTDTPCHSSLPYFTFFLKRGVLGWMIPDDTFVGGGMQKSSWEDTRQRMKAAAEAMPFRNRNGSVFFAGSPSHPLRDNISNTLKTCCNDKSEIVLAVMEKFKHLMKPLENHTRYKYLLAMRGRSASSRDKYLNLLNSTILWAQDPKKDDRPWFQWYHVLWKPFVNYIPFFASNARCALDYLAEQASSSEDGSLSGDEHAERIAAAGYDVGRFLTQERVDSHLLKVLRRYASLQRYPVETDPIEFVRSFYKFTLKRYSNAQVMPDDRSLVKYMLYSWLKRRIRQMLTCREQQMNETLSGTAAPAVASIDFQQRHGCWYI